MHNERNLKDVENFKQDTTQWGGDKMYLEMEIDSINYVKERDSNETSKYDKKYKYNLVLTLLTFIGGLNIPGLLIQTRKKNILLNDSIKKQKSSN